MIICNNEQVKNKIAEFGIAPDKIIPIKAFGNDYIKKGSSDVPDGIARYVSQHDPIIFTYAFLREGFYWETLVQGLKQLKDRWPKIGLINAGAVADNEPHVKLQTDQQITNLDLSDQIFFAGDLTHDEFLSAMSLAKLYLRTPTSDGECSSVYESLTLGTPVVAAENGNRPPSVVTYVADDPDDLCRRVTDVLSNDAVYREQIVKPVVEDTVLRTATTLVEASLR